MAMEPLPRVVDISPVPIHHHVFAIPLSLSLSLVALDIVWGRILFVLLSLTLIAANVDTLVRIGAAARPRALARSW
jgi:hypothetical protein